MSRGPSPAQFVARSLLIVEVAVAARLFFVLVRPIWGGDSFEYHHSALNLVAGNGYAVYASSPTVYFPPLYPLFVAGGYVLFGPVPGYVLLLQAFLGGAAAWLLYLLARRTLGERAGFVGALLAAACPFAAYYSGTILSEALTFPLLALTLLGADHLARTARRLAPLALLVGIAAALTALSSTRFAALPIGIALMCIVGGRPRRAVASTLLLLACGYLVALSPWVLRNAVTFGAPIPLTVGQQGLVFWAAAARIDPGDYHAVADREPLVARFIDLYERNPSRERELLSERQELERAFVADGLARIVADPLGYAAHRLEVFPVLWIHPAIAGPFGLLVFVGAAGLYGGAALGLWLGRRRWRDSFVLFLPAAYVVVFQMPFYVEHRYAVLSFPFLWLLAGAGYVEASSLLARRSRPGKAIPAPLAPPDAAAPVELSIVIPAFNEAASLGEVILDHIGTARRLAGSFEILVIDDGSTDGTPEVVSRFAAETTVRSWRHHANRGIALTLLELYAASRGRWVYYVPADGQLPAEALEILWSNRDGQAVVVGRRTPRADPVRRRLMAAMYSRTARLVLRIGVHDIDSVKLLDGPALRRLKLRSRSTFAEAEILARFDRAGLSFREVEVPHRPRRSGRGRGATPRVVLATLVDLLSFVAFERSKAVNRRHRHR